MDIKFRDNRDLFSYIAKRIKGTSIERVGKDSFVIHNVDKIERVGGELDLKKIVIHIGQDSVDLEVLYFFTHLHNIT